VFGIYEYVVYLLRSCDVNIHGDERVCPSVRCCSDVMLFMFGCWLPSGCSLHGH
jgi:hypothetical protein